MGKEIQSLIKQNMRLYRFGCSCLFVPISKTKGVKMYRTRYERDKAFSHQKRAHKIGLGPKAFNRFSLKKRVHPYIGGRFGYVTQRARILACAKKSDWQKLETKMLLNGFKIMDLHANNIGKVGKRLVCIDFDVNSVGK